MAYWILKTEPGAYSFDQLEKEKTTNWDGVRNYQARNNLRLMKVGDLALIYHSVGPKEIVGIARVSEEAFPDKTAKLGDWVAVKIEFGERLKRPITLRDIKENPKLENLSLIKQGRLSVCPVNSTEWRAILAMVNG